MKTYFKYILMLTFATSALHVRAQQDMQRKDTAEVARSGDRNVMLNAESANAGPRNVNVGLPASVGGTTILENGLPVVYFYWPEFPYKTWRMDGMITNVELYNLGQTAIHVGDVGFSVNSYDNLGTDKFQGSVSFNSNHFGLLNGMANISGPISNGWEYAVSAFLNFDPGTYKTYNFNRYLDDRTQMYKAALTRRYSWGNGTGTFTALYKFADTKSAGTTRYSPYIYHLDGSVSEMEGFRIGSDDYMTGQHFHVLDAVTGQRAERDALNDYGTTSHTLDLIGKNRFDNGLNFNYTIRLHSSKSGVYNSVPIGTDVAGTRQDIITLASRRTPLKSLTGLFELGKKSGRHDWKVGLDEWVYDVDKFLTEGVVYSQTISANPTVIDDSERGYMYEYHNGTENKTALFITDKWDISNAVTLTAGARFEYTSLRGDYINNGDIVDGPYFSSPRTRIKKDWFGKVFMVDGVYKMTKHFGLLAEMSYNELYGHLENYSAGNEPNIKQSSVPSAGLGVYYNHPLVSLVSKVTYITRDEFRETINFNSAEGEVQRPTVSYDIETLGWTTDIVATPFKNFNLHLLLTLKSPKYKNYAGTVNFASGESVDFNFSDNYVKGISKVLIEIDPSYQWRNLRIWGSARYFSKEYANLTNSLTFKGRWETFAGANYKLNKHLELSATVVNLLNQRGAKGSISGADLYTVEEAADMEGRILSGTYIRPFTVEFGVKCDF